MPRGARLAASLAHLLRAQDERKARKRLASAEKNAAVLEEALKNCASVGGGPPPLPSTLRSLFAAQGNLRRTRRFRATR